MPCEAHANLKLKKALSILFSPNVDLTGYVSEPRKNGASMHAIPHTCASRDRCTTPVVGLVQRTTRTIVFCAPLRFMAQGPIQYSQRQSHLARCKIPRSYLLHPILLQVTRLQGEPHFPTCPPYCPTYCNMFSALPRHQLFTYGYRSTMGVAICF